MNIRIKQGVVAATFGVAMGVAALVQPGAAHAEPADDHSDFLWSPLRVSASNRLYVGGLSGNIGSSEAQVCFNPKVITIKKPVP